MRPHRFVADPNGDCNTGCGLPRTNRWHVTSWPGQAEQQHPAEPRERAPLPAVDRERVRVGVAHPETSKAAAARALPASGSRRRTLLDMVAAAGPHGRTDDEMEMETGWAHQSVSAARNGLVGDGWLTPLFRDGQRVTRPTRTGNPAQAWTISEEGARQWAPART